jgi:transposase-like protein
MKQRKSYSAEMKAKIAMEAVKGQRTVQEIAGHYGVHPSQVAQWKRQVVENLPKIFQDGRGQDARADEELKEELYQQIGQLQVELAWLKKKSGLSR